MILILLAVNNIVNYFGNSMGFKNFPSHLEAGIAYYDGYSKFFFFLKKKFFFYILISRQSIRT